MNGRGGMHGRIEIPNEKCKINLFNTVKRKLVDQISISFEFFRIRFKYQNVLYATIFMLQHVLL